MRVMVTIHFESSRLTEMAPLLPAEQRHVAEMHEQGKLESIYISADRVTVWVVMKGETLEQVQQDMAAFPLYPYMRTEFIPLL